MRWDIIICALGLGLIPLANALLIRLRLQRRRQILSHFQTGILCLALAIIMVTLGNILWILLALFSGVVQAFFTETVFNDGLCLGFDRAIPLNESEDLIAWGLLGPLCSGLFLNIAAHFIAMRIIKTGDI